MSFRSLLNNQNKMRIVGLISGGKDSIYNVLQCLAAGHDVVALANISPQSPDTNELDSYMFQTVGHEGVSLIAEAVGLPLFRQTTLGKAHCEKLSYEPTDNDEVEDLYNLLSRVKSETNCEGVAVGAIASDYQRTRVENVCVRLGLTSFAYLWQQDQTELLRSMIEAEIKAVTIKVASAGLDPNLHLGLTLEELEPIVHQLNKTFGVNVCGEGGEYETFVLDCPLFHKKITLEETHITKDSTSGYMSIKSARLEPKYGDVSAEASFEQRRSRACLSVKSPQNLILHCLEGAEVIEKVEPVDFEGVNFSNTKLNSSINWKQSESDWIYLHLLAATNVSDALTSAKSKLKEIGLETSDIAFVSLWLRDMDAFADVNRSYVKELGNVAPSRACVATLLSPEKPVALEMVVCKKSDNKRVIHIQSVSHWAPANIGPYSQSVKVGGMIFVAGQIPLVMGSMTLLQAPLAHQLRLSLRHVEQILLASNCALEKLLQVTVFVAQVENVKPAVKMLKQLLPNRHTLIAGVVVSALPRLADIELLAVAADDGLESSEKIEVVYGDLRSVTEISSSPVTTTIVSHVFLTNRKPGLDSSNILRIIEASSSLGIWDLGLKIFFNPKLQGLEEAIKSSIGENPITSVPIVMCESPDEIMTIVGIGSTSHVPD